MKKLYCDKCKIHLTDVVHYDITEVTKNVPKTRSRRVYFGKSEKEVSDEESWCWYTDFHFCEPCFKTMEMMQYLEDRKSEI